MYVSNAYGDGDCCVDSGWCVNWWWAVSDCGDGGVGATAGVTVPARSDSVGGVSAPAAASTANVSAGWCRQPARQQQQMSTAQQIAATAHK